VTLETGFANPGLFLKARARGIKPIKPIRPFSILLDKWPYGQLNVADRLLISLIVSLKRLISLIGLIHTWKIP
jgi:hypothetical protein